MTEPSKRGYVLFHSRLVLTDDDAKQMGRNEVTECRRFVTRGRRPQTDERSVDDLIHKIAYSPR